MTVASQPEPDSPWLELARSAAHEWFRDHPGATFGEFDTWVVEDWEPTEFFAAGFGIEQGVSMAGLPAPFRANVVASFAAARQGLRTARQVELGRRQARNRRREALQAASNGLTGPGASVGQSPWWDGAQGGAA